MTKPEIELTKAEEQEVEGRQGLTGHAEARELVLDWKKRQTTRAAVLVSIELYSTNCQEFHPELYEQKWQSVYQHVFDSYQKQNKSLCMN